MRALTIGLHKGGCSKTTTAFTIGHELARRGHRVLWVDCDYQGSLSAMAGVAECAGANVAQVMTGAATIDQVVRKIRDNLYLVPADIELADVELTISSKIGRENLLRRALAHVAGDHDLALIDSPPSLSIMTINALTAADAIMIPLQPSAVDMRALEMFLRTISDVRSQINPGLQVMGCVLTFFDPRVLSHADAIKALDDAGLHLLATIGRSVRITEMAGMHMPLSEYDAHNPQNENYDKLTEAVEAWLRNDHN